MYQVQLPVDDRPATSFEYSALEYSAVVEVLKAYYDGLYRCDTAL